ncbi:MAG TPA: TetR/AcrR family transcriptional regulator [Kofleriaceae bacterium]|nr:TetR/AcrR family transcriptional regulator [Kofleriaceae bacterium]
MPRRRESYHHGDLRRALIDAALALIARQGGTGEVTLRAAARRAGVSHNAPYRHFADKGALLAAVAVEGFAELSRVLATAREGVDDPEQRFVATGLAYLRFVHERRSHIAVMFGTEIAKSRTPELQQAANDTFQVIKELAHDAGVTNVATARRLGIEVWAFVHGLGTLTRDGQVPASVWASPEQLAASGLRHLFRAFSQR